MKAVVAISLLVAFNALSATTPEPSASALAPVVGTNSTRSTYAPSPVTLPDLDRQASQSDVIRGKHFQLSGPLVHVAKSKTVWDVPRRFLHLINPFAKREPQPPIERLPGISLNAWSTTVGWHPCRTGLDDPLMNCDGGIGLVSVSRSGQ